MAMTAAVKDELARVVVTKPCCRKAEIATMLRFAGGLHLVGKGQLVIEAELDAGATARRLRKNLAEVYGHSSELAVVVGRRAAQGLSLSRPGDQGRARAGAPDRAGRWQRPAGARAAAAGRLRRAVRCGRGLAWRVPRAWLADRAGPVVLAGDHLPGPESALALVGSARRLGVSAKAREVRGVDRVVIRDGDAISVMLTKLGAHDSVLAWEERRMRREVRATANRLANFDDANLRRSARAAVAAGARVARAMEILGDDAPEHLLSAGRLRLDHANASLEELGALAEPPLTKDAIAGRIRRLLAMADTRADELGVPNTEASLTPEMLADAQ